MFTVQESAKWLLERDNFLILTHRSPDGDTIGSAAALCIALREQGKTAYLLTNKEITTNFKSYVENLQSPDYVGDYVVSVDIATEDLFPQNAQCYKGKVDLAIDHHSNRQDFGKENCVYAHRAACGEILYEIISLWGEVSAEVALPLYIAIATDTGCFLFGNTTPDTHYVAGKLMEKGLDVREINKKHFQSVSLTRLRLESMLVSSMLLFDQGKVAIVRITQAMIEELQATEDDTENISAFVGKIQGVSVGITLREKKDGICRISIRSNPKELKANDVCGKMGGGGHAAASGASFTGSLEDCMAKVISSIEEVRGSKLIPDQKHQ